MSVLRYNIVSDKKPYKPREEHLRNFFSNIRKGYQPVDSSSGSATLITDKATSDVGRAVQKKTKKRKAAKDSRGEGPKKKKERLESKIEKHKFK
jgi:hypothetical protein